MTRRHHRHSSTSKVHRAKPMARLSQRGARLRRPSPTRISHALSSHHRRHQLRIRRSAHPACQGLAAALGRPAGRHRSRQCRGDDRSAACARRRPAQAIPR
ncbi:hypothetical protein chiPu_0032941 [Chiloscyllium punctatum]|uniref:Uncharacterized protein n=1 Tax=Chiloscyllium punctatum TaxID=137246 RepID=A0A401U0V1_CHIPU|nr:hypothetical protein [Chiloscyllium punctatum]